MKIKRLISLLLLAPLLMGCAKLTHLQQLLTLKGYSENKDMQTEYVDAQNKKFEELVAVVKSQKIKDYDGKGDILAEFGEPIYKKNVKYDKKIYERWLYRYVTQLTGSEKIYLYFDKEGNLKNWEHLIPSVKTSLES